MFNSSRRITCAICGLAVVSSLAAAWPHHARCLKCLNSRQATTFAVPHVRHEHPEPEYPGWPVQGRPTVVTSTATANVSAMPSWIIGHGGS